jgi:hypothetical protein
VFRLRTGMVNGPLTEVALNSDKMRILRVVKSAP